MRKLIAGICMLGLLFCFQSCYKDIGNYDYTSINKISITAAKDTLSVLLNDTLKIDPLITQTIPDTAGLSYRWTLYPNIAAPLTRNIIGTGSALAARILDAPGSYALLFEITDKKTKIQTIKKFIINIVGKYNEGWLVLQEGTGGCDISMITPVDAVYHNIYSDANGGGKLPAGSHRLTVVQDRTSVQKIYVMSPTEASLLYFANFIKLSSLNDWFVAPPAVAKPQEYFINGSDERIFNNGAPYGINTISGAGLKFGLPPTGTYDMAPFQLYNSSIAAYTWFDKIQQRFYKQNGNTFDLSVFGAPAAGAPFDMNSIGKKLLYANTDVNTRILANCLFKKNEDDSLFVYQMDLSKTSPPVAIYTVTNAPGLATAKLFVMSTTLAQLYYVADNKIYMLDILAGVARLLYTFPAGTEVRAIKMYFNSKLSTDPDNNRLIGVATMEGAENKVYQFPLAATGDFTNNTYRKAFTGFGKINDIAFKRMP